MPQCIFPVAQCLTMYENIFECSTTQMIDSWVFSRHSQKRIVAKISVKVRRPASSWFLPSRGKGSVGGMVSIPFYSYTLFQVTRSRTPKVMCWSHEVKCNPFPCCWNYCCTEVRQWRWEPFYLLLLNCEESTSPWKVVLYDKDITFYCFWKVDLDLTKCSAVP